MFDDDDLGPVLALDVGGTKLAAAVVDATGWLMAEAVSIPTRRADVGDKGAALFEDLVALGRRALEAAGLDPDVAPVAVGCGSGGPVDAEGGYSPLNIPAWRAFPLAERLEATFGCDAYVDNDAKALAVGEGWIGAAAGVRDYIGMVVSTGVGGGIVLNGQLLSGAAGNAGHIGHMIVEPDGAQCLCGARGCLEAEASGTGIATITGRPAAEATDEVKERTGRLVGRAVASVANLLDLKLAVVAGSVALGFGDAFFAAAQEEMDRSCRIGHARDARIRPAGLGASGPLIGAAALAYRRMR